MKKFFNILFVVLGIIFSVLILIGVYFYITDPLNLKPLIFNTESKSTETKDNHSLLSESQEKALKTFGIDPADIPSEITVEQESCFEAKLGAERVAEIKAGDSPSATEYIKARDCI
jgi:hypothetical protein